MPESTVTVRHATTHEVREVAANALAYLGPQWERTERKAPKVKPDPSKAGGPTAS